MMEQRNQIEGQQEFTALCIRIKELVDQDEYEKSESLIKEAMGKYPHAPQPHNLIGLVQEAQGNHLIAMKHFRAAYALDPTYLPAQRNLEHFGTFCYEGKWAYGVLDEL